MKKIYTTALVVAMLSGSAMAQQLPNADFEGTWGDCTPWTGGASTQAGQTPESWTIAHVAGTKFIGWMGTTIVGEKAEGNGSASAVKLVNSPNSLVKSQTVPGYISLGTTWNTSNITAKEKDGGTWGGIDFTYRPDAIAFDYIHTNAEGSSEQASVVAYSWTGQWSQANVPVSIGNTPTIVTMINRDRNILGMEYAKGGEVTASEGAQLVAKIDYALTDVNTDWQTKTIDFEYNATVAPTMFNAVFAAGNYFSTAPEQGNTLTIDNVRLIYYSRLASVKVSGTNLEGFSTDKYDYVVEGNLPSASDIEAVCLGNSGSATANVAVNEATSTVTITVTNSNEGGVDVDGETSHVYTIKYEAAAPTEVTVTIEQPEHGSITVSNGANTIQSGAAVAPGTTLTLAITTDETYRLSTYTLDGQPVEGNTVVVPAADFTISAVVEGLYCEPAATTTNAGRGVTSIDVNGTTIQGVTATSGRSIYVDRLSNVVEVEAGSELTITSTGVGSWMHTMVYGDFDRNGWNVDMDSHVAPNGDLLWYNLLCEGTGSTHNEVYYDMQGNTYSQDNNGNGHSIGGIVSTFTIPADLAPGDYRMRYKSDWGSPDPCGNDNTGKYAGQKTIAENGGTIIDFTLRVTAKSPEVTVVESKDITGLLTIDMGEGANEQPNTTVILDKMSDDTYRMTLENFGATEADHEGMGDIVLPGITRTGNDLAGRVEGFKLMGGTISADIDLTGNYDDTDLYVLLDIKATEPVVLAIKVTFDSKATGAIGSIEADNANAPVEYFNLQGVRVAEENLMPGIYVRRQGSEVVKVLVK